MQQNVNSTTTTSTWIYVLGVAEQRTVTTTGPGGGTSTAVRTYLSAPGGVLLGRDTEGEREYLTTDLLGTPVATLGLAGGVSGEQLRAPYGQPRYSASASGAASNYGMHTARGFTGQWEDRYTAGTSGLDDFHARYYDPVIGRFSTADTAQPGLGDPLGLDNYAYVGGQVETATDPSGQSCMARRSDGEGCDGGGDGPFGYAPNAGQGKSLGGVDPTINAVLRWGEALRRLYNLIALGQVKGGWGAAADPLIGRSRNRDTFAGDAQAAQDAKLAQGGFGDAHDPLIARSRNGDTFLSSEIHSAPRLSPSPGTSGQPAQVEGSPDVTYHPINDDPCRDGSTLIRTQCVSWTGAGGGGSITDTWNTNLTLSNGQTNAEFRASATSCFYCGGKLDPNSPRGSERPVTGHIYPRKRAMKRASSQEVYNAYVIDVRGLRAICNSCNGIQGGERAPIDMVLRWRAGGQEEAQAIFDLIAQLYGFEQ